MFPSLLFFLSFFFSISIFLLGLFMPWPTFFHHHRQLSPHWLLLTAVFGEKVSVCEKERSRSDLFSSLAWTHCCLIMVGRRHRYHLTRAACRRRPFLLSTLCACDGFHSCCKHFCRRCRCFAQQRRRPCLVLLSAAVPLLSLLLVTISCPTRDGEKAKRGIEWVRKRERRVSI